MLRKITTTEVGVRDINTATLLTRLGGDWSEETHSKVETVVDFIYQTEKIGNPTTKEQNNEKITFEFIPHLKRIYTKVLLCHKVFRLRVEDQSFDYSLQIYYRFLLIFDTKSEVQPKFIAWNSKLHCTIQVIYPSRCKHHKWLVLSICRTQRLFVS